MPGLDYEHAHQGKTNLLSIQPTTLRAKAFREEVRRRREQGKGIEQLQGPERAERLRQEQERQDAWKAAFEHLSVAEPGARKTDGVESRIRTTLHR